MVILEVSIRFAHLTPAHLPGWIVRLGATNIKHRYATLSFQAPDSTELRAYIADWVEEVATAGENLLSFTITRQGR